MIFSRFFPQAEQKFQAMNTGHRDRSQGGHKTQVEHGEISINLREKVRQKIASALQNNPQFTGGDEQTVATDCERSIYNSNKIARSVYQCVASNAVRVAAQVDANNGVLDIVQIAEGRASMKTEQVDQQQQQGMTLEAMCDEEELEGGGGGIQSYVLKMD